jgi:hypothetical protein
MTSDTARAASECCGGERRMSHSSRRGERRKVGLWLALFLASAFSPTAGRASDLSARAQALVGPFLAQNFAAVCTQRDPNFFRALTGDFSDANAFAQHVKVEMTGSLETPDTLVVLRVAADRAHAMAVSTLRSLDDPSAVLEEVKLDKWCMSSGRDFVSHALEAHRQSHADVRSVPSGKHDLGH